VVAVGGRLAVFPAAAPAARTTFGLTAPDVPTLADDSRGEGRRHPLCQRFIVEIWPQSRQIFVELCRRRPLDAV